MRRMTLAILLALALLITPATTPLARALPLDQVVSFTAMRVVGGIVYVINNKILDLVDVADPQDAQRVGSVPICNTSYALDVVGGYAYVLGLDCLDVIDVHDPTAPQRVGTLAFADAGSGLAGFFSVVNGLAYMPYAVSDTMAIIDVHTPTTPTLQGTVSVQPGTFNLHATDGQDALIWRAAITSQAPSAPAVQYAYRLVTGPKLEVVDVQNPASPTLVGSLALQQGGALWASAGRVYVAGSYALSVIDVSQPTAPQLVTIQNIGSYTNSVQVSAGRIYLCAMDLLTILDASGSPPRQIGEYRNPPPARTVTLDRYGVTTAAISGIVIDGTQAFVADSSGGISRYDLTDPAHPILVARRMLGRPISQVAVVSPGQTIAVVQNTQTLLLNAGDLLPVGQITDTGKIAATDGMIYLMAMDSILVFDARSPAAPALRGSIRPTTSGWYGRIAVVNGLLYVTTSAELQIIDVHDPAHSTVIGTSSCGCNGDQQGLVVRDGFAYILTYSPGFRGPDYNGLQIVDVSIPTSPIKRGGMSNIVGGSLSLAVSGGFAYLASTSLAVGAGDTFLATSGGGGVISVANPDAPALVQAPPTTPVPTTGSLFTESLANPTTPAALGSYLAPVASVTSGSLAYSAGPSGLISYDLSATGGPTLLGAMDGWPTAFRPTDGGLVQPHDIQLSGGYALMVNGNALLVVDVRDPAHPQAVGIYLLKGSGSPTYTSGSFDAHVTSVGNRVYVVDSLMLQIVDLSNPAAPALLGQIQVGVPYEIVTAISIGGSMAYLSVDRDLRIFDVSDPAHPVARGTLAVGSATDIRVDGNQLALFGSVLATMEVSNPDQPTTVASVSAPSMLTGAHRINSGIAWGIAGSLPDDMKSQLVVDISDPAHISLIGRYAGCYAGCPLPPPGPATGAQFQATFVSDTSEFLRLAIFPSLTPRYRRGGSGSTMPLQAHNLPPNTDLELRVNDVSVGTVASGSGDVALALSFGSGIVPGHYLLSLTRPGGAILATTTIEISAAPLAVVRSGAVSGAISLSTPANATPLTQVLLPVVIRS